MKVLMDVTSLGVRTHLFLHAWSGDVLDRGEYIVLRTPTNPLYWYGNCLVLPRLGAGELVRWEGRFVDEHPRAGHRVFLIDGPAEAGALHEATVRGYAVSRTVVLTATSLPEPARPEGLRFVRFAGEHDWAAQLALVHAADAADGIAGPEHQRFVVSRALANRALVEQGRGDWWGAWEGDQLIGSLGLFFHDRVGRYQHVVTAPAHRRRGVAGALVAVAGRAGLAGRADRVVIVAVADSPAARLYRRAGFEVQSEMIDLCRKPA